MTHEEPLRHRSIAMSVSDSKDMAHFGVAPEHLEDAIAEITRHLLALGARIYYGGDLRPGGFTDVLFEVVARHKRDADSGDKRAAMASVLAYPVHAEMARARLREYAEALEGWVELQLLDLTGSSVTLDQAVSGPTEDLSPSVWAEGLSAMRRVITTVTDARIVMGGSTTDFRGTMPGVAEETLESLKQAKPVYLLGGLGGCAREICSQMRLVEPSQRGAKTGEWIENFADASLTLENGLSTQENQWLAGTVHVDQAVTLILRGLLRRSR